MNFKVIASRSHGLEVFKVYICGTYATEFLSLALANTYVLKQVNRYNRGVK